MIQPMTFEEWWRSRFPFAPEPEHGAKEVWLAAQASIWAAGDTMTDRESAVYAALKRQRAAQPSVLARLLNPPLAAATSPWCPVGTVRPGTQCALVPAASSKAVTRVLRKLEAKGLVKYVWPGARHAHWEIA